MHCKFRDLLGCLCGSKSLDVYGLEARYLKESCRFKFWKSLILKIKVLNQLQYDSFKLVSIPLIVSSRNCRF